MLSGTANIWASMSRFRISFDTAYKTRLSCKILGYTFLSLNVLSFNF